VILNRDALLAAISAGATDAETGAIVTFGALPTEPNTQFGYIEAQIDKETGGRAVPIARFVEKPDAEKAAGYLATGRFYWNTGIFLLKASTLLEEMRRFLPESLDAIKASVANGTTDGVFIRPHTDAFRRATNISIDHGIMEKTSRGMVIPVEMGWSDVGSWDAVWKLGSKDANENVTQGDVVALDTSASLLRSEKGAPLIATVGINHLAVIAMADAVFVSPLDRVSDVKQVVDRLKADARECVVSPPRITRSRGSYESIARGPSFEVKHITVDPGERLSSQAHDRRSAHWVLVRGSAEVTVGEQVSILCENESIFIPAGTDHALTNNGSIPVELLEVQCGHDLERDLPRLADE
jgi:mannose-1-phosphate guanylyltransferase/mannose-6-phosphate isomerase